MKISFCILHHDRLECLKKCVDSIHKYCPVSYEILILNQGKENIDILAYLQLLEHNKNTKVIYSLTNIGCPAGRKKLIKLTKGDYICTIDDDIYLTPNTIKEALIAFKQHPTVGVIGLPQHKPSGELISWSGKHISIKNKTITLTKPCTERVATQRFVLVTFISGGAQIFRKQLKKVFSWDNRYKMGFGDLDQNLQILMNGKWKKMIATHAKVIHDHTRDTKKYKKTRYNYLVFSQSYDKFIKKWGLKYDLLHHILYKYVFDFYGALIAKPETDWSYAIFFIMLPAIGFGQVTIRGLTPIIGKIPASIIGFSLYVGLMLNAQKYDNMRYPKKMKNKAWWQK